MINTETRFKAEGRRQKAEVRKKEEGRKDIIEVLQTSLHQTFVWNCCTTYYLIRQIFNWKLGILTKHFSSIKLMLFSTQALVRCPVCSKPTHRIHSRYERTLTDLPWADYNITLQLRVRKFFCINTLCKRRIFTERLASVTAPWARRTLRLAQRLTDIGLALGGAAGVRLSQKLGFSASRNTLLSLVRRIPLPSVGKFSTLGVDDFCFRKGQTYGTIVVDLERSRPVRLLSDHERRNLSSMAQSLS